MGVLLQIPLIIRLPPPSLVVDGVAMFMKESTQCQLVNNSNIWLPTHPLILSNIEFHFCADIGR